MNNDVLKEMTTLYVEDDKEILQKVGNMLERRVKQLYLAANGKEGLDLTVAKRPDVIITDLEMPILNGLEMIKRIRETLGYACPIIVVTAYHDEEHYTDLADEYVYKPVILSELIDTMVKLAGKYRSDQK